MKGDEGDGEVRRPNSASYPLRYEIISCHQIMFFSKDDNIIIKDHIENKSLVINAKELFNILYASGELCKTNE